MQERDRHARPRWPLWLAAGSTLLMVAGLRLLGRRFWCAHRDWAPGTLDAWSSHTSQHLLDPYTLTHVLHGIGFVWVSLWILPKLSADWRFFLVITGEAAWEVIENTSWVIEKYRENTASLNYYGDSILNSFGDVVACALGFALALRWGWRYALFAFAAIEILLLVWIRDSLLLNVLMFFWPIDAILRWQMGS